MEHMPNDSQTPTDPRPEADTVAVDETAPASMADQWQPTTPGSALNHADYIDDIRDERSTSDGS